MPPEGRLAIAQGGWSKGGGKGAVAWQIHSDHDGFSYSGAIPILGDPRAGQ